MPPKISDKTPGEKLLALHTLLLLQGERPISLTAIASALLCSKQTVLRLLAQLESSGYGKLEEPMRKGKEYFYRLAKTEDEILDLGATELSQLALCRNMLVRMLRGRAPADSVVYNSEISTSGPVRIMYKGYIDYAPFESQYVSLMWGIQQQLVCKVIYRKSIFLEPREFCFAPIRLVAYHETISILGWEVPFEGKARNIYSNWLWLYLQRCKSVKLTDKHFSDLPPIELTTGDKGEFGIMEGEIFKVKLLFNARTANYVHERHWSSDQTMELTEDGYLCLEMSVRSVPEIISWILGFGPDVTVLHPVWLREKILMQAKEIVCNAERSAHIDRKYTKS